MNNKLHLQFFYKKYEFMNYPKIFIVNTLILSVFTKKYLRLVYSKIGKWIKKALFLFYLLMINHKTIKNN